MTPIFTWLKKDEVFILAVILLVAAAGFGLGRLSASTVGKEELKIVSTDESSVISHELSGTQTGIVKGASEIGTGGYVASKTGTKYHLPWCAGAQSIKPENKVFFDTKEAAEVAGYTAAGNCKGL